MTEKELKKLEEFQKLIDFKFKNLKLLQQALTTPMRGNELGVLHYDDILETLGDSVLKTIFILKKYKEEIFDPEVITKTKQAIENNETLSFIGRKYFNLHNFIFKSKDQQIKGTGIIADAFEALCAAIFLDSAYTLSEVEEKIVDVFYSDWNVIIEGTDIFNKNMLLEFLQKQYRFTPKIIPEYQKIPPDHNPIWIAKNPKIVDPDGKMIYFFEDLSSEPTKSKPKAEQNLYKKILKELKKKLK